MVHKKTNSTKFDIFLALTTLTTFTCSAAEHAIQPYEMNWSWDNGGFLTKYEKGKTSFALALRNITPATLPAHVHYLFKAKELHEGIDFIYTHGGVFTTFTKSKSKEQINYDPSYHIHAPLTINAHKMYAISEENLQKLLTNKSIAWYTGAGISAGVVPTMQTLEDSLGMIGTTPDERLLNFLATVLQAPEETATTMSSFYQKCLHGKPTAAHAAITDYISHKNGIVFTENLDLLHERAGTNPDRIGENPELFKTIFSPEKMKSINILICIGLSHDDRGLIGYYKHHNPAGVICALCLDKPTYLNDNDYFLQADAQTIIPRLINFLLNL